MVCYVIQHTATTLSSVRLQQVRFPLADLNCSTSFKHHHQHLSLSHYYAMCDRSYFFIGNTSHMLVNRPLRQNSGHQYILLFLCHKVSSCQCYQTRCVPAGRTPAVGGDRRSSPARGPRQQQAAQRVVVGVAGTAAAAPPRTGGFVPAGRRDSSGHLAAARSGER